ncbi:MAG: hypothetical protein ACOVLB_05490, partial [Candidatus Nanopelagicus sp.]
CQDEQAAYPIIPPEEQVLGETVRSERIRPMGDVYFTYAILSLASLNKQITLIGSDGSMFNSASFDIKRYKQTE